MNINSGNINSGDQVLILSPDNKTFLLTVAEGKKLGTHLGEISLGDAIGKPFGDRIYSNLEHPFLLLEPTLEDTSSVVDISTKPNPRDCPVNLSVITLADLTVPCAAKRVLSCDSVAEYGNPPT